MYYAGVTVCVCVCAHAGVRLCVCGCVSVYVSVHNIYRMRDVLHGKVFLQPDTVVDAVGSQECRGQVVDWTCLSAMRFKLKCIKPSSSTQEIKRAQVGVEVVGPVRVRVCFFLHVRSVRRRVAVEQRIQV